MIYDANHHRLYIGAYVQVPSRSATGKILSLSGPATEPLVLVSGVGWVAASKTIHKESIQP